MSRALDALASTVRSARPGSHPSAAERARYAAALLEFARGLQSGHYFEDGAGASAEAMEIFRQLIDAGDESLARQLATSLLAHANCLHGLGIERAVDVFESAARLFGGLVQADPSDLAGLAGASNDLGCCLREQGHPTQALFHAEKSVEMFELIVADDGGELHHLAGAKLNLAKVYAMLERHEDALAATREGVEQFEVLAEALPDHFALPHAEAMDDLSVVLSEAGRIEEALALAERAAKRVAELAREAPARYLQPLARVCNNLGRRYSQVGRHEDALEWSRKAVDGFGVLLRQHRGVFLEATIQVRANLVLNLAALGQTQEALEVNAETLELARELGRGPLLVAGLRQQAQFADTLGRPADGLALVIEALQSIEGRWREQREALDSLVRGLALEILERSDDRVGEVPGAVIGLLEEILD